LRRASPQAATAWRSAPFHATEGAREGIGNRGARLLCLPPYGPELNPVELAFGKLERRLRSAAARAVGALSDTIGSRLDRFSPAECSAFFCRCGYAQSAQ
jgi:transposase